MLGSGEFGDDQFAIAVEMVEVFEGSPFLSLIQFRMFGADWELLFPEDESIGFVTESLSAFRVSSKSRHWAAFAGLNTYKDVLNRASVYGFNSPQKPEIDFQEMEMSAAMISYSLSYCFLYNLNAEKAISVRGDHDETLIWQTRSGDVEVVKIPNAKFDSTLLAFERWARPGFDPGVGIGDNQ